MSPIVRTTLGSGRWTRRALPLLALVTAVAAGCNARSSTRATPALAEPAAGAERGLPPVEHYAHRLDDASRDGLDISESMAADVRERAAAEGLDNVVARVIPPDDPAIEPSSADGILAVNTWHPIEDRARYAEKLRPALTGGGRLVVVDFTMESPTGPPAAKRLTVDTVLTELAEAGFLTTILDEDLPHQYAVEGRVR